MCSTDPDNSQEDNAMAKEKQGIAKDLILSALALILAALGMWSVFCGAANLSWPAVIVTDLYLFLVLLFAAIRSDAKARGHNDFGKRLEVLFPSRTAGVVIVILLLTALVSGFAGLYIGADLSKPLGGPWDALYFSFVTMTTVGYGDYVPIGKCAELLVMGQLISGVLLLFGVFPLLISRLSQF
jgi:Ion channel